MCVADDNSGRFYSVCTRHELKVPASVLCEDPSSAEALLGASPRKAAALVAFLPLAAAALLMTGTFGLALATGGQDTGQTSAVERNRVFGRSGCNQSSRNRAAGKFRTAALTPLSMICASMCCRQCRVLSSQTN